MLPTNYKSITTDVFGGAENYDRRKQSSTFPREIAQLRVTTSATRPPSLGNNPWNNLYTTRKGNCGEGLNSVLLLLNSAVG